APEAAPALAAPAAASAATATPAAAPAKPKPSPCARALHAAEAKLAKTKAQPEVIAASWEHLQAAKKAAKAGQGKQCVAEAKAAESGL
ncbi:hypothetical protein, partial [Phaeospirillum tilakii]